MDGIVTTLEAWRYCELAEIPNGSPVLAGHAYWLSKRSPKELPSRGAIDPAEIPKLLSHIVMIDCLNDDEFRVRLMGSDVRENDGRELTGKLIERESFGEAAVFFKNAFRKARDRREP